MKECELKHRAPPRLKPLELSKEEIMLMKGKISRNEDWTTLLGILKLESENRLHRAHADYNKRTRLKPRPENSEERRHSMERALHYSPPPGENGALHYLISLSPLRKRGQYHLKPDSRRTTRKSRPENS
jgi:hypothetical protein